MKTTEHYQDLLKAIDHCSKASFYMSIYIYIYVHIYIYIFVSVDCLVSDKRNSRKEV